MPPGFRLIGQKCYTKCVNTVKETIEVTFEDLTHDARGVCKIDGYPIFVKHALKGETALIEITKKYKSYGLGRLIRIKETSPFRKEPICEHFATCGGCNLMHMDYQTQLDFKTFKTQSTLQKLGQITTDVQPTLGMQNPLYYRNKATFHFDEINGVIYAGYYREGTHRVVDIHRCHTLPKIFSEILAELKIAAEDGLFNIHTKAQPNGGLKRAIIRQSLSTKELLITLITPQNKSLHSNRLIERLTKKFPLIMGIIQNVNSQAFGLGKKSTVLYGIDQIKETIGGMHYTINHQSFFQVNAIQAETMLDEIFKKANLKGDEVVIDAYAGVGHIGLSLAHNVREVIAIETVKKAVSEGIKAARYNHIDNIRFIEQDAKEAIQEVEQADLLVVDPPRKGLHSDFIDRVLEQSIQKMIYVSCNVATLARDLKRLKEGGYQVIETTPLDMFPQTSHIESITLLNRGAVV